MKKYSFRTYFHLKNPDAATTSVFCFCMYEGLRSKVYTGISVESRKWSTKRQRVSKYKYPESTLINAELDRIAQTLKGYYLECRERGLIPTVEDLRKSIHPEEKKIVLAGHSLWYGADKIGEFKDRDYNNIIMLFVDFGGCRRGDFQEITALPTPGRESELVEQLKQYLIV
jgi:hypothetical protein